MAPVSGIKRSHSSITAGPVSYQTFLPSSPTQARELLESLDESLTFSSLPEATNPLPARAPHLNLLASFLINSLNETNTNNTNTNNNRRALYLCGRPGCGKSACVKIVLERIFDLTESRDAAKIISSSPHVPKTLIIAINAMSQKSPASCLQSLLEIARAATKSKLSRNNSSAISDSSRLMGEFREFLRLERAVGRRCLLIIDELDALLPTFRARNSSSSLEARTVIEFLFSLAANNEIVLIAISNDINLIDAMSEEQQPKKLVFSCYSQQDIVNILIERLRRAANNSGIEIDEKEIPLFDLQSLQFIASSSSSGGDIRQALKLVQSSVRNYSATCLTGLKFPSITALTVAKLKKSLVNDNLLRTSNLSSHQQSALAAIIKLNKKNISLESFPREYRILTKIHRGLLNMNEEELNQTIRIIADHGFIKIVKEKITVTCDANALAEECQDQRIREILQIKNSSNSERESVTSKKVRVK